ncbi:SPOSA6832_03261, partial [Sporobolomyces salmonicolor]
MELSSPPLSSRAQEQMRKGSESPLFSALFKTFGNQWSEENPDGVVNAGLAENSLMHDFLYEFYERKYNLKIEHTDLTYGTSILGSSRIFNALSRYYSRYFAPHTPVDPAHIATSNGLSPMIEHLAAVISDAGDAWLLPGEYYNAFKQDLGATSLVDIANVELREGEHGELAEVEAMEREMQRRKAEGLASKITAVLVTNPHNPLGFCYKRETLVHYAKFAERWNLYLVVDEIYALSVFPSDSPDARPFTSILSIDVLSEAHCNPSRIIQLYGMSKDFGSNGLRAGTLVCQHNPLLLRGLASTAMTMRMGSPTDILWSALLNSDELPFYLEENQKRLAKGYRYLAAWLKVQGLPFRPANAGHFVLVDFREHAKKMAKKVGKAVGEEGMEGPTTEQEVALLDKFVDAGVYLGPGFSYAVPQPGFFRMTFSIRRKELSIGLARIEKVCELPPKAVDFAKEMQ